MLTKLNNICKKQFYFVWILLAALHWCVGNYCMKNFYAYRLWDVFVYPKWFILRMTFFVILCFCYYFLLWWIHNRNKVWILFTVLYAVINLVLLLMVWPGIWRWDEFVIYVNALMQNMLYWQSYLTSLYYIFSIMFIPVVAAPILTMIAINSLIVGYVVEFAFKKWGKKGLLVFIPFLFFPVLDSNLYPMRVSICAFLELFLIVFLYQLYQSSCITKRKVGILLTVAAVITVWRSESIYYILIFPIVYILLLYKKLKFKQLICSIMLYWSITALLFIPQYLGNKADSSYNYDLTSVVLPLVPLVEAANQDQDGIALNKIDQVVNVDIILKGISEGKTGIQLYWESAGFTRDYTSKQYKEFKKAYYSLILKYPGAFLKERFACFVHSNGFVGNTTEIFDGAEVNWYQWFETVPGSKPINKELRRKIISVLEWKNFTDYHHSKLGFGLIYNAIIPILFLLFVILRLVGKKVYKEAAILFLTWIKVPLIFLTAPSRLFMYYYTVYLIGYVTFFMVVICLIGRKKNGKKL